MTRSRIERIKSRIHQRRYDMTAHAMEEMAEDDLDILDVEAAVRSGTLARIERDDPRGTKYVIEGLAANGKTRMGVVGRFGGDRFVIITVYERTWL